MVVFLRFDFSSFSIANLFTSAESCKMSINSNESEVLVLDASDIDFDNASKCESMDFEEQERISRNFVFVDVQGFKSYRDRFICKEICLVSDEDFYHAIIYPPYPFEKMPAHYKRQAKWLYKQFHGLTYDCGYVHMIQVIQDVYPKLMKKTVVVKGAEKVKWIKHIFRNCGEIECLNFDDLDLELDEKCKTFNPLMCDYHLDRTIATLRIGDDHGKSQPRIKFHCAKAQAFMIEDAMKKSSLMYRY